MSDDVTPLDLATGKIGPFPKPIAIKSPGMFPELESWSTSTWLPPHQGVYLAPADRATEPPRELTDARIVLFVDFQDGATYDVSPVSRAESIALLASQAASLSSTEVMALGKLSQRVRGYRVVYGEAKAVGDLMSILNSVLLS
jgi:hypothetical protein